MVHYTVQNPDRAEFFLYRATLGKVQGLKLGGLSTFREHRQIIVPASEMCRPDLKWGSMRHQRRMQHGSMPQGLCPKLVIN